MYYMFQKDPANFRYLHSISSSELVTNQMSYGTVTEQDMSLTLSCGVLRS